MSTKTLAQLRAELETLQAMKKNKRMPLYEADVECDIHVLERAMARRAAERVST